MDVLPQYCSSYEFSHLFKLLIIGNSGVGKSSILMRFSDQNFSEQFIYTIGVDFKVKSMKIDGNVVKLQIWDTAGQERFKSFTNSYFRGSQGVVVVYDVTNRQSFQAIANWFRDIGLFCKNENVVILLVGNKCDTEYRRSISYREGQAFADEHGVLFIECSAKDGTNIDNAFRVITEKILILSEERREGNHYKSTVDIADEEVVCPQKCCFL